MENTVKSSNTIIRGSYTQTLNYKNIDFSDNFYISDLKQLIEEYTEEKNNFKIQIYQIELQNTKLLQKIHFLDKKCNLTHVTHSNTINFIILNYTKIKNTLDKLIIIYNKNLDYINYKKEKIYNINLSIKTMKSNINYYEMNN